MCGIAVETLEHVAKERNVTSRTGRKKVELMENDGSEIYCRTGED